ncbi:hypothetical protein INT47_012543 [Mucor saturninus]|uniref:Uncharacterized protein n=1 Tax=Mucor saturninus TaxID=64648 RepID=A0A8H7R148_9FUNG|nr:hypothetical protein INT47_012543 [Mucor saturninus]
MSLKELPFPKALNIIRPSSPLIQLQDSSHSSSTASSSPSTLSSFSSYSNNNNSSRVQPTIVTPSNFAYFQNNWASFKSTNPVANTVGVNPHRFLQRPRSNSSLSKSTFFSAISVTSSHASEEEEEEEEEDLDSIDGLTDEEDDDIDDNESEEDDESEVEDEPTKIVAKVKHGTIMNGKGEFVSKGSSDEQNSWLDEARANRKIADLEIEKASLLVLNTTLEAKLRQQTSQIVELQKRLQMNEGPLTPVSDKHVDELFDDDENTIVSSTTADEDDEIETDQVFQRIKSMLEGLILQAEVALLQKSKQSGKVLQEYNFPMVSEQEKRHNVEETLHKLTVRTMSPPPIKRSTRRVSDTSKPASAKMSRNLSRQSSPPVMMTSTSPRPFSPPPTQRSSSPRYSSQLRKSQDLEKPKWNY